MNNRFVISKLKALWFALSALVIVAGIVLYALMGFSYQGAETKTVEVIYGSVVSVNGRVEELEGFCEDAFDANGISYDSKTTTEELNPSTFSGTGEYMLRYTFAADTSNEAISAAEDAIRSALGTENVYSAVSVSAHTLAGETFYKTAWRGAIGIAVGALVALIYIGVRFGVGKALAGLLGCIHDAAFTLALLALLRIPVYAYTPVLFAALAVIFSLLLWMVQCMKMRENFKDPAYVALSAEEAVGESYKTSYRIVLIFAAVMLVMFLALGAVATAGVRLFMFSAIIPLATAVYSSLLFTPAIYVPFKAAGDRRKFRNKRNEGKKKAEAKA